MTEALKQHSEFQQHPEAILPTFFFIEKLARCIEHNSGQRVSFHSNELEKRFRPYTGGKYKPFVKAVEELGWVEVNHSYYPKEFNGKGQCKTYDLSDPVYSMLNDGLREYLTEYHKPKSQLRRR